MMLKKILFKTKNYSDLYLVKYLRPNIANMTWELLKVIDGAK